MALAVGCGGPTRGTADPDPAPDRSTPCGRALEHLDATLGAEFAADRATTKFGEDDVKRSWLVMRCAHLTPWNLACLTFSSSADHVAGCGLGNEPTLLGTAGPSEYQKAKFEDCVAAATTRDAFLACSYYKPGPGREPLHPDEPPP